MYSTLNFLANSMKAFIGRLHLAGALSPFAGLVFRFLFGFWREGGEPLRLWASGGLKGRRGVSIWPSHHLTPGVTLASNSRAPGHAPPSPPVREARRRRAMLLNA